MQQHETEQWMRQALRLAAEGLAKDELPIGAVVVLDSRVIAAAHTMERSTGRLLVHAELLALEDADRRWPFPGQRRDARLFTTLEPCLMCLGAAMSFFVGEVYYAVESPGDGAISLIRQWQRNEQDFSGLPAAPRRRRRLAGRGDRALSSLRCPSHGRSDVGVGGDDRRTVTAHLPRAAWTGPRIGEKAPA